MLLEFLDECGCDGAMGGEFFQFWQGGFEGGAECLLLGAFLRLLWEGVIRYLDDLTTTNFDS